MAQHANKHFRMSNEIPPMASVEIIRTPVVLNNALQCLSNVGGLLTKETG